MIQIGARNMQNFVLLTEVGSTRKPVLLKRGMSATIVDLLMSAEYILSQGNPNVVLCERGVKGFDSATRNLFDVAAVPACKVLSHLPIIVDPSHATGRPDLIPACALAGVAAGADGVHIEVHDCPEEAMSDGPQALLPANIQLGRSDSPTGRAVRQRDFLHTRTQTMRRTLIAGNWKMNLDRPGAMALAAAVAERSRSIDVGGPGRFPPNVYLDAVAARPSPARSWPMARKTVLVRAQRSVDRRDEHRDARRPGMQLRDPGAQRAAAHPGRDRRGGEQEDASRARRRVAADRLRRRAA